MNEPPPRPEAPPPHEGLSTRAKIVAGAFIGVLYAIGMSIRGSVFPGIVGGILAGFLCYLVLREVEQRRDRRR